MGGSLWDSLFTHRCLCAQLLSRVQLLQPHGPPGFSVRGICQARILEWFALSSSRTSSRPRDLTCVSFISCIGGPILYHHTTWEVLPSVKDRILPSLELTDAPAAALAQWTRMFLWCTHRGLLYPGRQRSNLAWQTHTHWNWSMATSSSQAVGHNYCPPGPDWAVFWVPTGLRWWPDLTVASVFWPHCVDSG